MPDDVGGKPFPDGEEPDEHRQPSHGEADEDFASVVLDEDFVRSARFHEPSAVERMLAAAQARAEADAARARPGYGTDPEADDPDGRPRATGRRYGRGTGAARERDADPDAYGPYGPYGGALRPHRGSVRWHRPVAWVLAVLMGIGLVALAFSAVYRGASGGRTQTPAPPPATSGVDGVPPVRSSLVPSASASAESTPPPASAAPRTG
ncbi:SCO2584 family spore wall biosynthesis protein [Streptomyces chrestomyceticus]|uniref:SCO2584 family spore wall biosynthesis protein n=1 Tax=Streptomyces chrestomyceticus TaxID=68185 RepID=UPI0035A990C5